MLNIGFEPIYRQELSVYELFVQVLLKKSPLNIFKFNLINIFWNLTISQFTSKIHHNLTLLKNISNKFSYMKKKEKEEEQAEHDLWCSLWFLSSFMLIFLCCSPCMQPYNYVSFPKIENSFCDLWTRKKKKLNYPQRDDSEFDWRHKMHKK